MWIADEGGLAATGRTVGLSASTTGKSLTRLEARLGMRLFHRITRSRALTGEGTIVLASARRMVAEAEAAAVEEELSGRTATPSGRLRLSLPLDGKPFLGAGCLIGRIPPIDLDIDFFDRQVDLIG